MSHFKETERTALSDYILKLGQQDARVMGGAFVGSFSSDAQDPWSDLDISFGIDSGASPRNVLEEFTDQIAKDWQVVHHFDVARGRAIYRVFLFANGMELDLSVFPEQEFGPKAPSFKLLFGEANEAEHVPPPALDILHGWAWHHVLHANSALHRGRLWQAEFWISALRDHIITMKCVHHGLQSAHGRGADQLPQSELEELETTLIKALDASQMRVSLNRTAQLLISEIGRSNAVLAESIRDVVSLALNAEFT